MKCELCSRKIETTFMHKIVGTEYVKGKKKKAICPTCQKTHTPTDIRAKIFS